MGVIPFIKPKEQFLTLGNLLHRKMSILCFVKLIYREHYKQVEIPRSILVKRSTLHLKEHESANPSNN